MKGLSELQELVHLRGIYAERQLQAVLGEFWENHFTTDYEKQVEYLKDIDEYDDIRDMSEADEDRIDDQIDIEVATMEWQEYDFFHRNALGNFGDLLLYSATSPAMLIYLDNVLSERGEPNENYPREILELYAFGEGNRYTQTGHRATGEVFYRMEHQESEPLSSRRISPSQPGIPRPGLHFSWRTKKRL